MSDTNDNGFSRPMSVVEASRLPGPVDIVASDAECAAIAARFGWIAVEKLHATLTLGVEGKTVRITGSAHARVTQPCIATGDPVVEGVNTALTVQLVPLEALEAAEEASEVELDSDALDILGYENGRFDLGDIVAETIVLAVDPWPRSPGASEFLKAKGVIGEEDAGSFGALAALRDKMQGGA